MSVGRPSNFDRDAAVETVMNKLWRDGYEASSVKALSEMLGITRSSFYNAFGTREALFEEALALYAAQSPDRPLADAASDVSVKTLFTEVFRAMCKARAEDPEGRGCLAVNSISELCNSHDELGPLLENAVSGNLKRIQSILQSGVENNELNQDMDVAATALAVQNLQIGLNVLSKIVRTEKDLLIIAETTLSALGLWAEPN